MGFRRCMPWPKKLIAQGKSPRAILGFNRKEEQFLTAEFRALGIAVSLTTVDGSLGIKGFVTDAMPQTGYTYLYTCGPAPMLRAIDEKAVTSGQFSFEERMGCGFGACMGCTCQTKIWQQANLPGGPPCWRGRKFYGEDRSDIERRFTGQSRDSCQWYVWIRI